MAFAIVLFASSLSCLAVYLRSRQALKDEVAEHILQAACAASVVVDGDHHPAFTSRDQEDSPEYTRAITSLAAFLSRTPGLQYVYTFVERDGELFMVLDPTPTGDRDRDGVDDKAHIMEPYSAGTEAMHRVLAEGRPTAESEPASDQWGTFMSAYAPVFDSSGTQVGAVGVDVAMGAYMQRLAGVRYALVLGLAIAVALSALVAMAVARLQATSARAQKTIDAMLEDLKTARDEASSAAKANAEFLAAMSHEIRNPMNAILGLSDVLIDADPPQGMRQDLELIRRSGTTLLAILNDVLDISKLEAGKFTLRPEPLDPRALMDDVVRLFTPLAREQSTRLDLRVDPAIPSRVLADPTRLCQIAGNLVSNALKFAKGGTVTRGGSPSGTTRLDAVSRDRHGSGHPGGRGRPGVRQVRAGGRREGSRPAGVGVGADDREIARRTHGRFHPCEEQGRRGKHVHVRDPARITRRRRGRGLNRRRDADRGLDVQPQPRGPETGRVAAVR